ncbi:MAG: hypothetical protein JWO05_1958 [Gemmatimonadetes bacterium]|nr:hypothetical protein [Gemmatimonadota bacterium]
MNASYEWLRALVPFHQTPAQLRDLLTAHTATVDELIPLRQDLAAIVVARVVTTAPHPDSDHLSVNKVDMGTGELLDVVCGAPNVQAGALYPFAPTGTTMPNGLKLERRKIRGALSNGMLCSARELGLGQDHEGIMRLDVDVPLGTPLLQAMPVGDTQVVIDVGANRPDLLSHLGIAREISALTGVPLALPPIPGGDVACPAPERKARAARTGSAVIHVEDRELARRYMGVVVRGVTVGPSPEWLVARVTSVGVRSINNVVDATNYILHELGQPVHAFDLAKLGVDDKGTTSVVVRKAKAGEVLHTLDGVERTLDARIPVIADAERPHAVAGVMGGKESEVTEGTTDLFLEVANFHAGHTRTARRALSLSTDASYRFERAVDPELAPVALERLVQLIVAVAGGTSISTPADVYLPEPARAPIVLRISRIARVLGDAVSAEDSARYLTSIGFRVEAGTDGASLSVIAPSWREDISGEIDLVEEVARLRGYDAFPNELRPFRPGTVPDDPMWTLGHRVRDALVSLGLLETRAMPFVKGAPEGFARVSNPLSETEAYLRRDVLDTLARRAEYNLAQMQGDVRLFEIGSTFAPGEGSLPVEELRVAALVMGRRAPRHFTDTQAARYDEWDAKAIAERLVEVAFAGRDASLAGSEHALWTISVDGDEVGHVSRVSLDAPVWAAPAFGVELRLATLSAAPVAAPGANVHGVAPAAITRAPFTFTPQPSTPAAEFDLALLLPAGRLASEVEAVIRRTAGEMLERLELFDEYTGEGVEAGARSVAWRLTFRHPERTLRDKEIDGRRSRILGVLESELNVRQRST